ncbi:MAG: Trm112 family protein [Pelistega sp.]|nr:Trm112 family protein [Pelistega sp.]
MNSALLSSLLCPLCKQALRYDAAAQELICDHDQLAFPIKDGIPVMLKDEARALSAHSAATVDTEQKDAVAQASANDTTAQP